MMSTDAVFNLADALSRLDQDEDLFYTLVEIFVEQVPMDMAATQAALDAGDANALARAAHRLKGAILQFSAPTALEATRQLEALGKTGTLDGAAAMCAHVDRELQKLLMALRGHLANRPSA